MRIVRGALVFVGIVLVFLASCSSEWEPRPILLMGGIGLGLCGIAAVLPEEFKERRKKPWYDSDRRGKRQG